MPIEIKDLFVTANVYDGPKKDTAGTVSSAASQQAIQADEEMKLHIIDQAVQQVL